MSSNSDYSYPVSQLSYFRSAYSPKICIDMVFPENSPYTKQEFADECNINILMSKYQSTGEMPVLNQSSPQYLDVTGVQFQESMQFVAGAKSMFMELPSSLRSRFHNDPAQFLDFVSNPSNRDEMASLGLLKQKPDVTVPDKSFVAPAASEAAPVASPPISSSSTVAT